MAPSGEDSLVEFQERELDRAVVNYWRVRFGRKWRRANRVVLIRVQEPVVEEREAV